MFELKENILATLAYYDIFDFPLKAEEVWARLVNLKHLQGSGFRCQMSGKTGQESGSVCNTEPETCTPAKIQQELNQLVLDRVISRVGNYYFLFDREYLVPLRLKREKIARRKWRIARRATRWLRLTPYLRAVFASGSLAMRNTDELSDLDVLIVVKHGRIWLTRLLVTAILSILCVRRRGRDRIAPDKICLNHYIADQSLHIPYKSIYNAQTYANLIPIYIRGKSLVEEFKRTNNWVLDYVYYWNIKPEFIGERFASDILNASWPTGLMERILDVSGLGDLLNNLARKYQSNRIARNPVTTQTGGRVIFNDDQLEFHPHSIEIKIIQSYNERLNLLGLSELAIEKDSGLDKVIS